MGPHDVYIKRCLEIAKNGLGYTRPNPMVGCVIVANNKIVSEGFTSAYGGNHAEVNAITHIRDTSLLKQATLYVTLEPCSHFGKTPPCSDLIIKSGIPNVVIGCLDDNILVAGKGKKKLEDAGILVTAGVLENECKWHHKRFFTYHNKKRPYIILKWAQTKDGFIAPSTKHNIAPVWITNSYSRQLVHKWRAEEQAILIGANTVVQDNPSLTTRYWTGQNPIRVVICNNTKLDNAVKIFDHTAKTIVINPTVANFSKPLAKQICSILHNNHITSIIIEGGRKTLQTFIDENIWDEARVFTGNKIFGSGVTAPSFKRSPNFEQRIGNDLLKTYHND